MNLRAVSLLLAMLGCAAGTSTPPAPVAVRKPAPAPPARQAAVAPGPVLPHEIQLAALRADGHVFARLADGQLVDWDSQAGTARHATLGDDVTESTPFVPELGTRFVVARAPDSVTHLELWDTSTLAKVSDLEGTWNAGDGSYDLSADGSRFAFTGCISRPPDTDDGYSGWSDCETAVYTLAEGKLLHRTRMERVQTDAYPTTTRLSPNGTYVAVGHDVFPLQVFESASGLPKLAGAGTETSVGNGPKFAFFDDAHILTTVDYGTKLLLTDLSGASPPKRHAIAMGRGDGVEHVEPSPGRTRIARMLSRGLRCRVVVWTPATGKSTSHVLPNDMGPRCWMQWLDEDTLVAQKAEGGQQQMRIDAASGKQAVEPLVQLPAYEHDGFRVYGSFGAQPLRHGAAAANPRDLGGLVRPAEVVTPSGVTVDVSEPSYLDVVNGRLLVTTRNELTVITREGKATQERRTWAKKR